MVIRKISLLYFVVLLNASFSASEITQHYLYLDINPESHFLNVRDKVDITTDGKYWEFQLSDKMNIKQIMVNKKERSYSTTSIENDEPNSETGIKKYRVKKKLWEKSNALIDIAYSGKLYQDDGESSFSREKIAFEITGTISSKGVFLTPAAYFYPTAQEEFANFETVIKLPAAWDAVSEGTLVKAIKDDSGSEIFYKTQNAMDGIYITAAIWKVNKEISNGVEFYTYFFPEDSSLAQDYLKMSIDFTNMYSEMISPYPFSKFAVVENFFPTGYGMPSYTVLGQSVVHLPFIVHTSLGHEILHNWWGNSVFVGENGNWCEGLTSYQADYFYKLRQSEESARQYRKNILKDYTSYVNDENEFPLSEFINRSDMSSRSIGYGKAMMVFHMMEQHLGAELFMDALKQVVDSLQFDFAEYSDFFNAFERVGDENFNQFQEAWITEIGAPQLNLRFENKSFFLEQLNYVKPIWVSIRYSYSSGKVVEQVISIKSKSFKLDPPPHGQLIEVAVDPDYHIMRRLHESEMDATLRSLLSEEKFVFVVPEKTDVWKELAKAYNGHIADENEITLLTPDEVIQDDPIIYLGVLPEQYTHLKTNGTLKINGGIFKFDDHSLVYACKQENGQPGIILYSTNPKELIPIARKIPHYGKYGYLVFNHGQNVLKGNHESKDSPLIWGFEE